MVPPAAENRGVLGTLDCPHYSRSSFLQLDGERSRGPFQPFDWPRLPDCIYTIAVTLIGADGRPIAATQLRAIVGAPRTED